MSKIKDYLQTEKQENLNIYLLFGSIIFFSQFFFLYDEEKIIALCLISFIVIFYYNTNLVVYDFLNEKAKALEIEFVNLFKEKIFIMRKLRIYWRVFLDLEDQTVEIFFWVKKYFLQIIELKKKNRKFLIEFFIKNKYNLLLERDSYIYKNIQLVILKLLSCYLQLNNKTNTFLPLLNNITLLNNWKNQKIINTLNLLHLNSINFYFSFFFYKYKTFF